MAALTHWVRRVWHCCRAAIVAVVALAAVPAVVRAHEMPSRVAVQILVRADSGVARVLVRVPLEAMRDIEFPIRGAGYLDLAQSRAALQDAAKLWVADAITLVANGTALPTGTIANVRASLPSDHGFDTFASALRTLRGAALDSTIDIPVPQAMLDVEMTYALPTPTAALALQARFAHLGVRTSTRVQVFNADGTDRTFLYDGDEGLLPLQPGWWYATSRFITMGAKHLLGGLDHLLFLLCLIIPVRRFRPLVGVVTAFTVAHSITLAASAMGYVPDALWFPPMVEFLVALSIVCLAIENVIGAQVQRRWLFAFGFGLVHGFAFSGALAGTLQFAGGHLVTALAAFNIGIELAQLAALAVAIPLLSLLFTRAMPERTGVIIGSVLIAHTSWHWMTERFETLRQYEFTMPALDLAFARGAMQVAIGVLVAGGAVWALSGVMTRLSTPAVRRSTPLLALITAVASLALLPSTARAQAAEVTTMTGVYTAEQAAKGREVFMASCTGCHTVASHSGPAFAARWMRKPLSDFYNFVSHLMPKSAPGTLSEDEYVWVTAYVLKLNGMPASARELSAEPELLSKIRIDSVQVSASGRSQVSVPKDTRRR